MYQAGVAAGLRSRAGRQREGCGRLPGPASSGRPSPRVTAHELRGVGAVPAGPACAPGRRLAPSCARGEAARRASSVPSAASPCPEETLSDVCPGPGESGALLLRGGDRVRTRGAGAVPPSGNKGCAGPLRACLSRRFRNRPSLTSATPELHSWWLQLTFDFPSHSAFQWKDAEIRLSLELRGGPGGGPGVHADAHGTRPCLTWGGRGQGEEF